ncbi:AGAP005039-PA-like protein [Anopheles sinensis]|uniref:AGAP005039-PA-like protein n=1 Tax=Anopheles sinensis TaxID=74873 RepID=A0A084WKZ0_ANOSI|nr:AGAP005039-PA-like protein [Anopheles sinensis]
MSDDDARLASAVPSPNCAEDVTTSTEHGSHALEQSNGKGDDGNDKSIAGKAKVPTTDVGEQAKDETVVDVSAPQADDHETPKGKRKCVQFSTTLHGEAEDMTLRKFIEGDEILDKKNPFKDDDQGYYVLEKQGRMQDKKFYSNAHEIGIARDGNDGNDDVDNDNEFITKEEILRQSKYVKTYIKNPDKRLNYDKSVIQKLNAIKAQGREVRDVVVIECTTPPPPLPAPQVRPPVPAPRAVYQRSDRNNNNRSQRSPQQAHTWNPKPMPRARREYAEVKVRTGSADAEESLYDSNEVVLNALKFDSRFRQVEFGSQDDIDTIAEKTEDAEGAEAVVAEEQTIPRSETSTAVSTPAKGQPEGRKSTFAEDVKKSFSNTVKSADFMKYLQSKGLSLVPAKKSIDGSKRPDVKSIEKGRTLSSPVPVTPPRQQTKLSVLTKFLQQSLFTPKTPNDPAYSSFLPRSSTPTHARSQLPLRNGHTGATYNGSLVKRSVSVDAKPKVNFKQFDQVDAASIRRPVSVNDFDRPKLRTGFANQSMSRIESARRPVKNAGVQVNLSNGGTSVGGGRVTAVALPPRPGSWQPVSAVHGDSMVVGNHHMAYTGNHRTDNRFHGGASSLQTVAPLYAEPLRELTISPVPLGRNRSVVDSGYHIYEQTPDNLRREMLYGKIGHHPSNGWHPQDRRSYSSMQEGGVAIGNGTYGRLRPLYVSSPLSTQSTPIRRASETLDREQILHRIYDFCRRSIRNSKSSVHSNQTEPLYQGTTPSVRLVGSGTSTLPIERPRVQRVQSLINPRTPTAGATNYTRAVGTMGVNQPPLARRNQHDRNIENIYAFVNKK